jgi:serine/threonine protein kinase
LDTSNKPIPICHNLKKINDYYPSREIGSIITIDEFDRRKFVVSDIHKGGMGIVYQLLPVNPFHEALALKSYLQDQLFEDFEKEARIWFSVSDHPNIAQPFWYGLFDKKFSILAEWYPTSVNEYRVETSKKKEFQTIVLGILSGLSYAYEKHGVIHRDIKPSNILLDKVNNPKINDFGISILIREKNIISYGTKEYMAPELFIGYPSSAKTDIYALGATLFEIITTKQAIDFVSIDDKKKELERIQKKFGLWFKPFFELILACIQDAPNLRPSSYTDLYKILKIMEPQTFINRQSEFEVTGRATVLVKQGKAEEAISLLQSFLKNEINNSLVLSTLGTCYVRLGKTENAIENYEKACATLNLTKGLYKGTLLPDPYANLAFLYLSRRRFEDASKLLESLWQLGNEIDPRILFTYPEIGWYLLYQGDFVKSQSLLMTAFRTMKPNSYNIQWLILSLYLSGKLTRYRIDLYALLMESFPKFDTGTALQALLIANALEYQEQRKLHQKILADCYANLRQIADEMGLEYGFERLPLSANAQATILMSLDDAVTGGKYNGVIRQSS